MGLQHLGRQGQVFGCGEHQRAAVTEVGQRKDGAFSSHRSGPERRPKRAKRRRQPCGPVQRWTRQLGLQQVGFS